MLAEEVKSIFSAWSPERLSAAGVSFRESLNPVPDRGDDYRVIYEAVFEPNVLDKARIEFWITDTGHVAIGIEKYERIRKRTGLITFRHGFALGHEPKIMNKEALQILFDAVSLGKISISVKSLLKIITSVKLFMWNSHYESLVKTGYQQKWISPITHEADNPLAQSNGLLIYRPW
jgi:hypothetical protein